MSSESPEGPPGSQEVQEPPRKAAKDASARKKPPSNVRIVLTEGRRQLWMSQPFLFSRILTPFRKLVLDPSLAISSILLPTIVPSNIADVVIASFLSITVVQPIRLIYGGAITAAENSQDSDRALMDAAQAATMRPVSKLSMMQPASDTYSQIQGAVSFICSAIKDFVSAFKNPEKMKRWFDTMTQLSAYLEVSGVADELEEAIQKPLYRGRLLDNFKILNDCQELLEADRFQRTEIIEKKDDPISKKLFKEEIMEGRRMMRFATAAYGTEMILGALDREVNPIQLEEFFQAIAHHTRIDASDVKFSFMGDVFTGDHTLHHFVAVDHKSKSVVLAIRGTQSLSDGLVDLQGMSSPFCGGCAHSGIAEMAENVWKQSGLKIKEIFEEKELSDYGFTVVGHSLGAGTACLLNIKCHVEELVGKREIKCYAFAPPPTFFFDASGGQAETKKIERSIENCIAYINDNDAIPFLSIAAVRRLAGLLDAVDNKSELMWFWNRWRIFHEYDKVPQDIVDSVSNAINHRARAVEGEAAMTIPSRAVVWCRTNEDTSVTPYRCDPHLVAECSVFLCLDMIADHGPDRYETSLDIAGADEA